MICEICKREFENEEDLIHCFLCHRDVCKKCSVDIISDFICEDCYEDGSW